MFLPFEKSHAYRAVEGHHTAFQKSGSPVSEASHHSTEASDDEGEMLGDREVGSDRMTRHSIANASAVRMERKSKSGN